MTKTMQWLIRVFYVIVLCMAISTSAHQLPAAGRVVAPAETALGILLEWLRLAGGVLGMILGGFGAVALYRMSIKTAQRNALEKTNQYQREQIAATESRLNAVIEDNKRQLAMIAERDIMMRELQSRTDITKVLGTLDMFMKQSNQQYTDKMQLLHDLLNHLMTAATEGTKQATQVLKMLESLSRRFGKVEEQLANGEEEEERPTEERRKEPRR